MVVLWAPKKIEDFMRKFNAPHFLFADKRKHKIFPTSPTQQITKPHKQSKTIETSMSSQGTLGERAARQD